MLHYAPKKKRRLSARTASHWCSKLILVFRVGKSSPTLPRTVKRNSHGMQKRIKNWISIFGCPTSLGSAARSRRRSQECTTMCSADSWTCGPRCARGDQAVRPSGIFSTGRESSCPQNHEGLWTKGTEKRTSRPTACPGQVARFHTRCPSHGRKQRHFGTGSHPIPTTERSDNGDPMAGTVLYHTGVGRRLRADQR